MYIVTEFNAFEMKKPLVFTDELEACKHLASAIVIQMFNVEKEK